MDQKKANLRDVLNAGLFIVLIGVFFLLNLVVKAPDILISERRIPASFPELSIRTLTSGSFMSKFENYAADRFVFRDTFRTVKAAVVFGVYRQTDKSGLYFGNAGIGEFKSQNPAAVRQSAEKIKKAAEMLEASVALQGCRVFYSMIPDKSIYAGKFLPGFDLRLTESILSEILCNYAYIPLADCLTADSFYRTDLHWDQPALEQVTDRLVSALRVGLHVNTGFGEFRPETAGSFYGVYSGQMALPSAPDVMRFLDIPGLRASRLNDRTLRFEECPVYDRERLSGVDPYDLFLQGPQSVVLLENPDAPGGDLIFFRDSFGSCLAPLLAKAYSRIIMIDLRYIDMRVLEEYVDFRPGSDVLFLYSSQILNNPGVLKI